MNQIQPSVTQRNRVCVSVDSRQAAHGWTRAFKRSWNHCIEINDNYHKLQCKIKQTFCTHKTLLGNAVIWSEGKVHEYGPLQPWCHCSGSNYNKLGRRVSLVLFPLLLKTRYTNRWKATNPELNDHHQTPWPHTDDPISPACAFACETARKSGVIEKEREGQSSGEGTSRQPYRVEYRANNMFCSQTALLAWCLSPVLLCPGRCFSWGPLFPVIYAVIKLINYYSFCQRNKQLQQKLSQWHTIHAHGDWATYRAE